MFPQLFRVLPNFHECFYLTIRLRARVFYEQIVNEETKTVFLRVVMDRERFEAHKHARKKRMRLVHSHLDHTSLDSK